MNDLWAFTEEHWDRTAVNVKGYFAMIGAAAPHMCRHGAGAIVNTSSGSGFGHPAMVAYATAKEGVVGLTRTAAKELGRFGVRGNAIRPFATGMSTAEYAKDAGSWMRVMTLTMGSEPGVESRPDFDPDQFPPRKISPLVVWLCTDAATHINGRTFHVGGDEVSLLSEPAPERTVTQPGGWVVGSGRAEGPHRAGQPSGLPGGRAAGADGPGVVAMYFQRYMPHLPAGDEVPYEKTKVHEVSLPHRQSPGGYAPPAIDHRWVPARY